MAETIIEIRSTIDEGVRSQELGVSSKNQDCTSPIVLTNVSETVHKQLSTLGLTDVGDLIYIKSDTVKFPDLPMEHIFEKPVDKKNRLKTMIKAHKNLVRINEKNEEIFGPFLKAIVDELKQQEEE